MRLFLLIKRKNKFLIKATFLVFNRLQTQILKYFTFGKSATLNLMYNKYFGTVSK